MCKVSEISHTLETTIVSPIDFLLVGKTKDKNNDNPANFETIFPFWLKLFTLNNNIDVNANIMTYDHAIGE